MGVTINGDADQWVARGGGSIGAAASIGGTVEQFIAKDSASLVAATYIGGEAGMTMHQYGNLGAMQAVCAHTRYDVELLRDGEVIWADSFNNQVVVGGLNRLVDSTFGAGDAAPAWYIGLVDGASGPGIDDTDVMASHAGWSENVMYSDATRPAYTPGSVASGSVDNSADRAVFHMNAAGTVAGFFLTTSNDYDPGTAGVLYGVADFNGGNREVEDGDILRVACTVTLSLS